MSNAGPPFVAGEALCPKCAGAYKTDVRYPGALPPAPKLCVVCRAMTRCRVK